MTYRFLQIFLTVAECGKMSEAAKKLYITQSSVSQAIASIESEYGVLLFERLSHRLYLTPAGKELLVYARNIVFATRDMDEFMQSAKQAQKLRVGATVTVGTCVIIPILSAVREAMPGVDLSVFVSNTHVIEEKLLDNSLDAALVEGTIQSGDLVHKDVVEDRLVLICPPRHPFDGRDSVDAAELRNAPMILREAGSGTRALFEEQMRQLGIDIQIKWECSNSETIKNGVKAGYGLSVISRRLVRDDVQSGTLWACDVKGIQLRRHFATAYHKNKHVSESLHTFLIKCEEYARREGAAGA